MKIFILLTILLTVSSCHSSLKRENPSDIAREMIAKTVDEESNGNFKLISFKILEESQNGKLYQINYQATLEAVKNGGYVVLTKNETLIHGAKVRIRKDEFYLFDKRWMVYRKLKTGMKFLLEDKLTLIKSEKGWLYL